MITLLHSLEVCALGLVHDREKRLHEKYLELIEHGADQFFDKTLAIMFDTEFRLGSMFEDFKKNY
jgi:hypothetical protein